jgi:prepilin-type N-terminal cleavage/methylation domain-containing protein
MQLATASRTTRSGTPRTGLFRGGFTLAEVVIALAVLATMAAGCYLGFNSLNTYAISSRLYTEAQAVAQNQIDMILSKGPFDPKNNKIPAVLQIGTTTTPNVFVYRDPVTGSVAVTGTMRTTISDAGYTMTYAGSTADLNLRRATVQVSYIFRNTTYNVSMDTLRTADL